MPEVNGRLKNTKNVFVDVLLPAHFFARSFHGLCLKRAEQVDDERVFDHGHDLFFLPSHVPPVGKNESQQHDESVR